MQPHLHRPLGRIALTAAVWAAGEGRRHALHAGTQPERGAQADAAHAHLPALVYVRVWVRVGLRLGLGLG